MMKKTKKRKIVGGILALTAAFFVAGNSSFAEEALKGGAGEPGLYQDIFDQSFYSEGINQLDLGRWARKLLRRPVPSANVNIFDEVPDSSFFSNRHARKKLSAAELGKGSYETEGPDLSVPMVVLSAEQQGTRYEFLIEDARKDQYVLRFDPYGAAELNTAAEVIASRFYYALGYNVPQATIVFFNLDQLVAGPEAFVYDNTGFKKKLTQKLLEQYMLFVPLPNGLYRASASKVPAGKAVGKFSFMGRGKKDAQDLVNHRDRREIRALGIFSAWLNNDEMLESNTQVLAVAENGQTVLKYYLTRFVNTLGGAVKGPKDPMLGYEHMVDYGEAFKAFWGLGFFEKPWQKKQRMAGEKPNFSDAVGYFSNDFFDPGKYKNMLPYEAFRLVTRADGFWAAKIMMSFSEEDIRAMVQAGQYSHKEDEDYIVKVLAERRDILVRHWLLKNSALDQFAFSGTRLSFEDLASAYGMTSQTGASYEVEITSPSAKVSSLKTAQPAIDLQPEWLSGGSTVKFVIRDLRETSGKPRSSVTVLLNSSGIQGIRHED